MRMGQKSFNSKKSNGFAVAFLHGYDSLDKIELSKKPFRKAIPWDVYKRQDEYRDDCWNDGFIQRIHQKNVGYGFVWRGVVAWTEFWEQWNFENYLAEKKVVLKWIVKIVRSSLFLDLDPLQIYTVMIYWRLETFVQPFFISLLLTFP